MAATSTNTRQRKSPVDDATIRATVEKRAAARRQAPSYKQHWQVLKSRAEAWQGERSLLQKLVVGPCWSWPRRAWQRAWPKLQESKAGWVVIAPWLLLIGFCILSLVFDMFGALVGADAPPDDAGNLGLIGFSELGRILGSPGGLLADCSQGLFSPVWLRRAPPLLWLYRLVVAYGTTVLASATLLAPLHVLAMPPAPKEKGTSHGSATWGTWQDANNAGLLKPQGEHHGLALGRFDPGPTADTKLDPRYRAPYHAAVFAPTRTGKGVSTVIPNLLEYLGSVVCIDLKGELYAVTARRRKEMGHAIARIDPFGVTGKPSHQLNWLDAIDPKTPAGVSEALNLANALVVRGKSEDSHWDEAAAQFLQGLILFVACMQEDEDRHMGMVWQIASGSGEEFAMTLKLMAAFKHTGQPGKSTPGAEVAASAAKILLNKDAKERASVLSTLVRHIHFLSDPRIIETLKTSSFAFEDLKRRKLTVYLIVPPEQIQAYNRYARAFIGLGLQAMMRERRKADHAVLFLLDEFFQLGRCEPVARTISIMGGLGVVFLLILQNVGQLKSLYDDWEGFLSNCSTSFFGVKDLTTAEYISKAMGKETILTKSHGQTTNRGGRHNDNTTHGTSENESQMGRPLLDPAEVLKMDKGVTFVFGEGQPPFKLRRLSYLTDSEYADQFEPNPLHA